MCAHHSYFTVLLYGGTDDQALFPSRLEVILGDSKETIPTYTRREELAGRNPKACNIIFVDGDHSEEGAYSDVVAFELLANRSVSRNFPEKSSVDTLSPYKLS